MLMFMSLGRFGAKVQSRKGRGARLPDAEGWSVGRVSRGWMFGIWFSADVRLMEGRLCCAMRTMERKIAGFFVLPE